MAFAEEGMKHIRTKLYKTYWQFSEYSGDKYDVLLICPKSDKDHNIIIPSSLLSIAAPLVENNYRVRILDQRLNDDLFNSLDQVLKKGVVCVGLSFTTGSQIINACEIADYIKENYPETKVVFGGIHATILPKQTAEFENVDIVVVGDGEKTFLGLVRALESNNDLRKVKGIIFKENNKLIQTPKQDLVDLNEFYKRPYFLLGDFVGDYHFGIITSKGCPERCAYCIIPSLSSKWRAMKPELVIEQIKDLLKLGVKKFDFHDDNFFVDLKRVDKILDLIIQDNLKFRWWGEARIDYVLKMDDEFLAKLKRCGLVRLYLGAESGSDRILELIDKKLNVEMIKKVNLKLKKAGIIPEFTFMANFPTETKLETKKTIDLMNELKKENPNATIWKLNTYSPYPETKLFDLAVKEGFVPPKDLRGWGKIDWYRKNYSAEYQRALV